MTLKDLSEIAPGVPRYSPAQSSRIAAALDAASAPTLFQPLRIRALDLHNRIAVSPMCQYSSIDGHLNDYHVVHLGRFAMHGAGLVFVEATAVTPAGRITPGDSGIWADSHIGPLRRVTDMLHAQGAKAGIQLAHAGRKASMVVPWLGVQRAEEAAGGWPGEVVGPSAIRYAEGFWTPREMTLAEIKTVVGKFAEGAARAVEAGFDVIEIHAAHGYLLNSFLSPLSNTRTDEYGGSFENRIRIVKEVAEAIRAVIPSAMPLWLRISSTDWMEWSGSPSWTVDDSTRLARLLPSWGVDVLDVSSAANVGEQRVPAHASYQTDIARQIRKALRAEGIDRDQLKIALVGRITEAEAARALVQEGEDEAGDLVLAGRKFLVDPAWVVRVARELKVPVTLPIMMAVWKI